MKSEIFLKILESFPEYHKQFLELAVERDIQNKLSIRESNKYKLISERDEFWDVDNEKQYPKMTVRLLDSLTRCLTGDGSKTKKFSSNYKNKPDRPWTGEDELQDKFESGKKIGGWTTEINEVSCMEEDYEGSEPESVSSESRSKDSGGKARPQLMPIKDKALTSFRIALLKLTDSSREIVTGRSKSDRDVNANINYPIELDITDEIKCKNVELGLSTEVVAPVSPEGNSSPDVMMPVRPNSLSLQNRINQLTGVRPVSVGS